jgi:superfamily II DNA or RNA helicase
MTDAERLATITFRYPFRKYQRMLLDQLGSAGTDRSYHVVAPPGAGKTILGLELIRRFGQPAVVFAPTSTVQEQWADKLAMFRPVGSAPDPGLVSLDPASLATVNVFTYQLIAAPAEAGTLLGQAARAAWREDLLDAGRATSAEDAEARLAQLEANNPSAFASELSHRVLRLKHRLLRQAGEEVAPYLHANARRLVGDLVARGVRTVVLDECHHLLDYWALVLRHLLDRLTDPFVVGLTATLPDVHDPVAFENYDSLLVS